MKDVIYLRCCGLDVHKDTIAACVRWSEETGESHKENRVFGTTTQELEKLARWMEQHQVRQVAMESTGVYWLECFGRSFRNQTGQRSAHP
jgi:transposase